jgi:hypothetical protein
MPKPVTLKLVPKSFGDRYLWVAAFQGNEETGPVGSATARPKRSTSLSTPPN